MIVRTAGYLLAIVLLGASIWYAVSAQQREHWAALTHADPVMLVALLASVTVSALVLPGIQFWIVTRPFVSTRALNLSTMQALIAAGALLNYTPVKAGLIGRVAYLRHFHGVGYRAAFLTHLILVAVFVAACAVAVVATQWSEGFDLRWWFTAFAGTGITALAGALVLRAVIPADMPVDSRLRHSYSWATGFLAVCMLAQAASLLSTAVRWWIVFGLLDQSISLADAWLAAIIHIVTVAGGIANGLGFREWLIGIGGQLGWLSVGLEADLGIGVTVALVDRAAEAVILIVFGLIGLLYLRRVSGKTGSDRN